MILFGIKAFSGEGQGGADILRCQLVFALDLLEIHTAGEAANGKRYRHARPSNYRLAMANVRIDDDAVIDGAPLSRKLQNLILNSTSCVRLEKEQDMNWKSLPWLDC
jgi:hypothetical protein